MSYPRNDDVGDGVTGETRSRTRSGRRPGLLRDPLARWQLPAGPAKGPVETIAQTQVVSRGGQQRRKEEAAAAIVADATSALLLLPAHSAAPARRTAKQRALRRQVNPLCRLSASFHNHVMSSRDFSSRFKDI